MIRIISALILFFTISEQHYLHINYNINYIEEISYIEEVSVETETNIIETIHTPSRVIALTFDDGPGAYTDYLLDLLYKYDVVATFFVMGYEVNNRQNTFLRTVELGHEIGNHTWFHENITTLSRSEIILNLQMTEQTIESIAGIQTNLFRPPFGALGQRERNILSEIGYSIIMWSIDPRDWQNRDVTLIYQHVIEQATDGDIIILHDIHYTTYRAMYKIIPSLIEMDFGFVTVTELLGETRPGHVYRRR